MKSAIFRARALTDIDEAYRWYEEKQLGLGTSFMVAIEHATSLVEDNPEQFPHVRGRVRRVLLRKFPYGLFYIVRPEFVSVIAVMHHARDPRHWQRRVRTDR